MSSSHDDLIIIWDFDGDESPMEVDHTDVKVEDLNANTD